MIRTKQFMEALLKRIDDRADEEAEALSELLNAQDLRTPAHERDRANRVYRHARLATHAAIRQHAAEEATATISIPISPENAQGCATKVHGG